MKFIKDKNDNILCFKRTVNAVYYLVANGRELVNLNSNGLATARNMQNQNGKINKSYFIKHLIKL